MGIRTRITLFFTLIVFAILTFVSLSIYYYAYSNRNNNFNTRLRNRSATYAKLLSQPELFNKSIIHKIDASTTIAMLDKSIQAYDNMGTLLYSYSDIPNDTIPISQKMMRDAQRTALIYFKYNNKDAVAYHFSKNGADMVIITAAQDPEGNKNLAQLKFILWVCFIGGNCITILLGFLFSKSLLNPIRKIADEINEISVQNLTRRIKSRSQLDEWTYLVNTINVLLNRLEESFHTQSMFIANASHELSTPLTSIYSQLEVAVQKERDPALYKQVINSVLEDVYHLYKLTQTLLDFAMASGNSGGIELGLIRIDEILLRIPKEMAKLNESYHVKLNFRNLPLEEDKLLVHGNENLLFTAIKNVVINACKYSSDHQASVSLTILKNKAIVSIADEGMGIAEAILPFIFQPFFRADESRDTVGFGLGLSLASKILKLHNSEISVDSKINKGTNFTISIPIVSYYNAE